MDLQDFHIHLRICFAKEASDREFQLNVAGVNTDEDAAPPKSQENQSKTSSVKHHKSGAVTETKSDRKVLLKEIGSLRVNKKTGEVVSFKQPELPEER